MVELAYTTDLKSVGCNGLVSSSLTVGIKEIAMYLEKDQMIGCSRSSIGKSNEFLIRRL